MSSVWAVCDISVCVLFVTSVRFGASVCVCAVRDISVCVVCDISVCVLFVTSVCVCVCVYIHFHQYQPTITQIGGLPLEQVDPPPQRLQGCQYVRTQERERVAS